MYEKMSKINILKWTYGLFGHNYRVATLSTLYLTVLVTTFGVWNQLDNSNIAKLMRKKAKNHC